MWSQPGPQIWHFANLPKTDKMDAKLYCRAVALNTTLVFKNFQWIALNSPCTGDLNFMNYWEAPVKPQIPSTLLETPLIRNIWRISPQQLSWLEEWKPNISNILYMEWNMAKHINTNPHGLWHFGVQLCPNMPQHQQQKDPPVTCSATPRPFQPSCLSRNRRVLGWWDRKLELSCEI